MKLRSKMAVLLSALTLFAPIAQAAQLQSQNLKQLIAESESIISGQVQTVTDGISEQGLPYTEVTIKVSDAALGKHAEGSEYTFRQFGLLKPRTLPNGNQMLAVAPEGFPRWNQEEVVVVFMHKAASLTGLRTTAGMAHGKFVIQGGKVVNEFDNQGIFENLEFADGALAPSEQQMVNTEGAYNAVAFMSLLGKAVSEQWISNGKMK
ncbi:MAG: hypothetical protein GYB40_07530 [Vibrionaceae bacterium]|nr:hypothetical protein [Vibrionaceae bacterium]